MKIKWFESFPENPTNPARTDMQNGVIEINRQAYNLLPSHTKQFVIHHEIGHFVLKTLDECKADDYALSQMALKTKYSLRNHIDSVYLLARDDVKRKYHALMSVLTVMANLGDKEAIKLLQKR
jgi:hypothetical protein